MLLISKGGVDLSRPLYKVPPINNDERYHLDYRQTPYIVKAAFEGNLEIVEYLVSAGCSLTDTGFICLDR